MGIAEKARCPMTIEKWSRRLWRLLSGRGSAGRYGVIGLTGVALDFVIYAILVRSGVMPVIATSISTLAGITNNYTWNSLLNFRLRLSSKRGARFLSVGLIGLAGSAGLLQLIMMTGLDAISAKWLSIPVIVGGQFLANKFWTFRAN